MKDGIQHIETHNIINSESYKNECAVNLTKKCKEALKDTIRCATEINKLSHETSVKLNIQKEQINGINNDVQIISDQLKSSEHILNGIKSWWGSLYHYFTPATSKIYSSKHIVHHTPTKPILEKSNNSQSLTIERNRNHVTTASSESIFLQSEQIEEFNKDINRDLDHLSDLLDNMQLHSLAIQSSLESQNSNLSEIQTKIIDNSKRMITQKKELQFLMNK